jgi:hypothetical protein
MDHANGIKLLFFLAEFVADLTAPKSKRSRFAAMHALTSGESFQTLRGPWSGTQASMARADLLSGYRGFAAVALLPVDEGLAAPAVSVWLVFVRRILG